MGKKVAIVDYKLGNLFSVLQACKAVKIDAEIVEDPEKVKQADAIILPGVGAFEEAMINLEEMGLKQAMIEEVNNGKPLFGICLGLQLMFGSSEEFGSHPGLNLVDGSILRFPTRTADGQEKMRVPQISWNRISFPNEDKWKASPLKYLKENGFMYFVHSYYASASDQQDILTQTTYGDVTYCSSILKDNIFATQFHPEKSGEEGISVYQAWGEINGLL